MPKEKSLEEKLKFLQSQVRIGGKGTVRRKKKIVHQTFTTDDKKLQSALKKISVNTISGIEEVNIIKDDLSVIHFNNPKAQASLGANTFAVSGHGKHKQIVEMLPELLPQLSHETVVQLRRFASDVSGLKPLSRISEDDDVPMLVGNFDEASKNEVLSGFKNELVQECRNLVDKSSAINSTQSISTPENEILKYVELNPVDGSQCQDSENILDSAN